MMPVARAGLAEREGGEDFLMAWVSVPDLALIAYPQRYEHVRRRPDGRATVRFVDRGPAEGFLADLELDRDGFVVRSPHYPPRPPQLVPRAPVRESTI